MSLDDDVIPPPPLVTPARILAVLALAGAGAFAWLWHEERTRPPSGPEVERATSDVHAELERAARERDAARQERETDRATWAEQTRKRDGEHQSELDKLVAERTRLVGAMDRLEKDLADAVAARATLKTRADKLEKQIAERAPSEEAAVRAELAVATGELTQLGIRIAEKDRTVADLKRRVAELENRTEPAAAERPMTAALRAHLDGVLVFAVVAGADAAALQLGSGPYWLPMLASRFADQAQGVTAVQLAARLQVVDGPVLLKGLAVADRTETEFVIAAGLALRRAGADAARPAFLADAARHPSAGVRLAVLELFADDGDGAALVHALSDPAPAVAVTALDRLVERGHRGRLLDAVERAGTLSPPMRSLAWRRLLTGPESDLPRLARTAVAAPGLLTSLTGFTGDESRGVIGEVLAMKPAAPVTRVAARLLGLPDGATQAACWKAAAQRGDLGQSLVAAARRPGVDDEERAKLAGVLPVAGLTIDDAASLASVIASARPSHLPFLLVSATHVGWAARLDVAVGLHRLEHPRGARIVQEAVGAPTPGIRARALRLAARLGLANVSDLATLGLRDVNEGVRRSALFVLHRSEGSLSVDEATTALTWAGPTVAPMVLAALERRSEDVPSLRRQVLTVLAEQDAVVADATVARWAIPLDPAADATLCRAVLRHANPAVRARAAEAIHRIPAREASVRVHDLEPLVQDSEFSVRVHVARALGGVRHDLARTALVRLARDEAPHVREVAQRSLGHQDSRRVIPVVRQGVLDDHPWVRNAARIALLSHGMADEAEALLQDLEDPVLGLRTRRALDRILSVDGKGVAEAYRKAIARLK